jgi:hypothetical protein
MSGCKCKDTNSCSSEVKEKCKERCDDCTCNSEENPTKCHGQINSPPCLDNVYVEGMALAKAISSGANERLSYCYSNERAPKLWRKKFFKDFNKVGFSLKESTIENLPQDMAKFMRVYINNTVLMSQDVEDGMFSLLEYCALQEEMLGALNSFSRRHIMEVLKGEIDVSMTWEQIQLLIDCVASKDFEKSSFILNNKLYKE